MDWLAQIAPGNAPDGAPILSVLGKKTYRFANAKAAWEDEEQIPFVEADEYWGQGKPDTAAVKVESDLVAYKPMTDVILIGEAQVPKGQKAGTLDIGIQVGPARKIARVFGNRKVYVTGSSLAFTDPEPFSEMPLDYGRAYGGKDERSDEGIPYAYPKNPVGKGFVIKNHPKALQDLALPNLEDPRKLLTPQNLVLSRFDRWKEWPQPMGFGYVNKNSHPRFTWAGLPPDQWTEAEAGRQKALRDAPEVGAPGSGQPAASPPMLNLRFFNGASPDLCFPYLRGDEAVHLAYLDRETPRFSFSLPGARPKAWLDVGQGPEELAMTLHTVVIYKNSDRLTMTWRGCAYYGGPESMKNFTKLEFGVRD